MRRVLHLRGVRRLGNMARESGGFSREAGSVPARRTHSLHTGPAAPTACTPQPARSAKRQQAMSPALVSGEACFAGHARQCPGL